MGSKRNEEKTDMGIEMICLICELFQKYSSIEIILQCFDIFQDRCIIQDHFRNLSIENFEAF